MTYDPDIDEFKKRYREGKIASVEQILDTRKRKPDRYVPHLSDEELERLEVFAGTRESKNQMIRFGKKSR